MKLTLALLFASLGCAQSQFFAVYGTAQAASSPKPSGGMAFCASTRLGIWSCSGTDFTQSGKSLATSAWSGAAIQTTMMWGNRIYILAAPGGTTTNGAGSSTGISFNGSALFDIPVKREKWWSIFVPYLVGPATIRSSNGVNTTYFRVAWGAAVK
jgi:hypothetical protein